MPTINSADVVQTLIDANGKFGTDPQLLKIVQYLNYWGGTSYGLVYVNQNPETYAKSSHVQYPRTIWQYNPEAPSTSADDTPPEAA